MERGYEVVCRSGRGGSATSSGGSGAARGAASAGTAGPIAAAFEKDGLAKMAMASRPRVWDELNFIRYIDVPGHLAHSGLDFTFNQAVMHELVTRLFNDPIFAERMPPLVRAIGIGLKHCGLLNALIFIPPRFQTPMEVRVRKP